MFADLKRVPEFWNKAIASRGFRNQLLFTLVVFCCICLHQFYFLRVWQLRQGLQVNDIVLNCMPPLDFSLPIFCLEYSTLFVVFLYTIPHPDRFVKGLQMFGLMLLARTMTIYFFPLEAPKDMVPLYDPVALFFFHTKEIYVTKDLFFSGHVGALSLLMLISTNKYVKRWAAFATVLVGILIMWQHVHYTLDIVFAPIVSYVVYRFVLFIHRETRYGLELQRQEW